MRLEKHGKSYVKFPRVLMVKKPTDEKYKVLTVILEIPFMLL